MVTMEEGYSLAKQIGCLFLECSAITRENVEKCFGELATKVKKKKSCMILPIQLKLKFWVNITDNGRSQSSC